MMFKLKYSMLIAIFLIFFAVPIAYAADPTVGAITGTDPITLSAGANVIVQCNATITDTDGYLDVSGVNATLWDSIASTEGSSNDYNEHYTNTSCNLSGGSGNTINAECSFQVHYSANPAEWTCRLIASDGVGTGSNDITTMTINTLKAMSVTSSITFPEQALGVSTSNANEQSITVSNIGNTEMDISLDGYASSDGDSNSAACTVGTIVLANLKYNTTSAQDFTANMTSLTDSPVTLTNFNLAAEITDETASTKDVHWKILIPNTEVGGTCTGNIVVSVV